MGRKLEWEVDVKGAVDMMNHGEEGIVDDERMIQRGWRKVGAVYSCPRATSNEAKGQ